MYDEHCIFATYNAIIYRKSVCVRNECKDTIVYIVGSANLNL